MTRIVKPADCGNSPKSRTLVRLVSAIAVADPEVLRQILSEDVVWRPIGMTAVSGAADVCRRLVRHGPASALHIRHVITHGRSGSVDGVSEYRRNRRAFYLVVDFTSASGRKVREITSFSTDISGTLE